MESFIDLLENSKNQYQALLEKTEEIGANVNTMDTAAIRKYQQELSFMLDEAQKVDKIINEIAGLHLDSSTHSLFQERFKVMRSFLKLNSDVAGMINAKRSVLQSEYLKIKKGRSIIGYQSSIKPGTRIINETF